eukprot:3097960-Prymnesium_polylepis.1
MPPAQTRTRRLWRPLSTLSAPGPNRWSASTAADAMLQTSTCRSLARATPSAAHSLSAPLNLQSRPSRPCQPGLASRSKLTPRSIGAQRPPRQRPRCRKRPVQSRRPASRRERPRLLLLKPL